jgi:penicillin-binding protein 1A
MDDDFPKATEWPNGRVGTSAADWDKVSVPQSGSGASTSGGTHLPPEFWPTATANPLAKGHSRWWWIKRGIGAFALLFALILAWLAFTAPLSKSLQPIAPPQLTLTAANGQPIARNGAIVDSPVFAKNLPKHVVQAFLSIEDRRFYSHWGVDPRGLARAAWSNVNGSGMTQGGSTITQQLAKFTFLTPERSMTRKAREMLIAFWLEARLSKDEILQRYLSNVYFGDNVYGLRAASMHYFYRQPEKLTLSQAAMLAGLVQAPSRLAPTKNPKLAAKRARMVLNAMAAAGYLNKATADATRIASIDVRDGSNLPTGTYFADWAMPAARDLADESYSRQTLKTTLDSRLQDVARNVVGSLPYGKTQVALVAMRTNGEVLAMIGGRSYKASSFNRATQALRQPGSTFKLFVYLAALRSGLTPDSIIDDTPITQGEYQPKNSGDHYRGKLTLRQAFAQSSNVAAVRLYRQLGGSAIIRAARDLGIKSPLAEDDPSLALGTSGVTLLELTSAYAGIAANVYPTEARAFKAEERGWLDWFISPQRSFDSTTEKNMRELLSSVVNNGSGKAARLRIASYGKTGTSQDNRDAYFIGFAGDLVVGVWIGNDDNTPLKGISGGGLPARLWASFMARALPGAGAVRTQKPVRKADPDGPVKPLDLPEMPDVNIPDINIPDLGDTDVKIDKDKGVILSTDVGGLPIDVSLGRDGIDVKRREVPSGGGNQKPGTRR